MNDTMFKTGDFEVKVLQMYELYYGRNDIGKLISFESIYRKNKGGGIAVMNFGTHFLMLRIQPNSSAELKTESVTNTDSSFYFEKIMWFKQTIFLTGTVKDNTDGKQYAFMQKFQYFWSSLSES